MLAWRSLQNARYTAVRRLTCAARARMAPYVWPTMVATPTMATPLRSKQLQSRLRHSASADPAGLLLGLATAAGLLSCSAPAASEAAGSRNRLISRLTGELQASMERVVCLNDRQIEQAVSLLNAILDLDYFTEEEEQLIFRHAVCAVLNAVQHTAAAVLSAQSKVPLGTRPSLLPCLCKAPPPGEAEYSGLRVFSRVQSWPIWSVHLTTCRPFMGLLREKGHDEGLGEEQARALAERLVELVQREVSLPYLQPKHEWQLVSCVIELLVTAMRRGECTHVHAPVHACSALMCGTHLNRSMHAPCAKVRASSQRWRSEARGRLSCVSL